MNNSAKKKMKLQWKNRRFYFFRFDNSQFLLLDALPFCDSFVLALPWQPKMSVHTHTHNGGNAQINSWFWKKTKKKDHNLCFSFPLQLVFLFSLYSSVSSMSPCCPIEEASLFSFLRFHLIIFIEKEETRSRRIRQSAQQTRRRSSSFVAFL